MTTTLGIKLNAPEAMPVDRYLESRTRPPRNLNKAENHDKLRQFLVNDRKVLRFYCLWDDRENMFGELRDFVSPPIAFI